MKQNYTNFRSLSTLVVAGFIVMSCVNQNYDFENIKDVNTDITVGGSEFAIPIGSLNSIPLSQFLTENDFLTLNNGKYEITQSGVFNVNVPKVSIDPFTLAIPDISVVNVAFDDVKVPDFDLTTVSLDAYIGPQNQLNLKNLVLPTISMSAERSLSVLNTVADPSFSQEIYISTDPDGGQDVEATKIKINYKMPENVSQINYIDFGDPGGKGNLMKFKLEFDDQGTLKNSKRTIEKFFVEFPEGFLLSKDDENTHYVATITKEGRRFEINTLTVFGDKPISFYVKKLTFSPTDFTDGTLSYTGDIEYGMKLQLEAQMTGTSCSPMIKLVLDKTPLTLADAEVKAKNLSIPIDVSPVGMTITVSDIPNVVANIGKVDVVPIDMQLNVVSPFPDNFPLDISGNAGIQLPKIMVFEDGTFGFDNATNKWTISYADLLDESKTKSLKLKAINVDQVPSDGVIELKTNFVMQKSELLLKGNVKLSDMDKIAEVMEAEIPAMDIKITNAAITTTAISANIPNQQIAMNIDIANVPKEILSVKAVQFAQPSTIKIKVNLTGIPSNMQVGFGKYTISLPEFLIFEDSAIQNTHTLVLDDKQFTGGAFETNIKILGLLFKDPLTPLDGKLTMDGKLSMGGNISVPGSDINSADLKNVVMTPLVEIGQITIGKVTAKVNPDFAIDKIDFSLNDIPDFLTGPGVRLDLFSVAVALDVKNSMDVKVDLGVQIIPYKGNTVITSQKVSQDNIVVQAHPSTSAQEFTQTNIWLSNSLLGMPDGYTSYLNPTLVNLIETIPDKIEIQPTALVDPTKFSVIDLNKDYTIDMSYKLIAPLALGKDFSIAYTESVDNLQKDLSDYLGHATTIELLTAITNDIPLQFELGAKPMDANGVELRGVKIAMTDKQGGVGLIRSCDAQGQAIRSDVVLTISETTKGALSKLDKIDLTFTGVANQAVAGQVLRANQSLKVQMAARIPGGITVKQ